MNIRRSSGGQVVQPELMNLGERAGKALEAWQRGYAAIRGAGVSDDAPNGHMPNTTVGDLNSRVTVMLAALVRLQGVGPDQMQLIAHRLAALKAMTDTIEAHSGAIVLALDPWQGATATDMNGNLQIQLALPDKGSSNFDLGTPLSAIFQQCTVGLDALPFVAFVAGDDGVQVFAGIARAAEQQLALARAASAGAGKEQTSGTATAAKLKKLAEQADGLVKQIQEHLTAIGAQRTTGDSNAAEITQKLAQVREVSKSSDTLEQRVTSFTSQFEAFETQMKARLTQFAEFEAATKDAERINGERETTIASLVDKADTMIRGATTAGLSKSLDDAREHYEKRLAAAQWYFLGSVVFLLVCSLPIAAQLIPGPWQQYFVAHPNGGVGDSAPWLSAIGKLILVIPGTWAAAFFASNYAELFHLSREYAHKAAIAKALDGFQREAPHYKQEIVGSVFVEIQDNPGSRKAPRPATPQNPVTQKFFEKVLEAIKVVKDTK
jgi:hypothetical protein